MSGHSTVANENDLRLMIRQLGSKTDPNATVYRENGDELTLSVRDGVVLILFHQASLDPPYLSASLGPRDSGRYFEFIVGDTPTPVPEDRCIPFDVAEDIVLNFVRSGILPQGVNWIED
jgi:hypothetical protein